MPHLCGSHPKLDGCVDGGSPTLSARPTTTGTAGTGGRYPHRGHKTHRGYCACAAAAAAALHPKAAFDAARASVFVAQTSSALCEINLVSLYLPTFYTEQLGVPLRQLARYTTPPMA
jgi:hypothetical protein